MKTISDSEMDKIKEWSSGLDSIFGEVFDSGKFPLDFPASLGKNVEQNNTGLHYEILGDWLGVLGVLLRGRIEPESPIDSVLSAMTYRLMNYNNYRIKSFLESEKPEDRTYENYEQYWDM